MFILSKERNMKTFKASNCSHPIISLKIKHWINQKCRDPSHILSININTNCLSKRKRPSDRYWHYGCCPNSFKQCSRGVKWPLIATGWSTIGLRQQSLPLRLPLVIELVYWALLARNTIPWKNLVLDKLLNSTCMILSVNQWSLIASVCDSIHIQHVPLTLKWFFFFVILLTVKCENTV